MERFNDYLTDSILDDFDLMGQQIRTINASQKVFPPTGEDIFVTVTDTKFERTYLTDDLFLDKHLDDITTSMTLSDDYKVSVSTKDAFLFEANITKQCCTLLKKTLEQC